MKALSTTPVFCVFAAALIVWPGGALGAERPVAVGAQAPAPQTRPGPADVVTPLAPGLPIRRELKGIGQQSFSVRLEVGQYLEARVEQEGVDVVVSLDGPSGNPLLVMDSPNGTWGPEPIKFVAAVAAVYRVEVRSLDPSADGRFEIEVRSVRAATDSDKQIAEAMSIEARATSMMMDNVRDAIPLAERAVSLYEKAGAPDTSDLARCTKTLADLYENQAMYTRAEPLRVRALDLDERALGLDAGALSDDLENLARTYEVQGLTAKARPLYERSLAICRKVYGADDMRTATSMNNLALLYNNTGEVAMAEPLFLECVHIVERKLGAENPSLVTIRNNLGLLYMTQANYPKAEPQLLGALAIAEKVLGPDDPTVASVLVNVGTLFGHEGDYAKAEQSFMRALKIREQGPNPDELGVAGVLTPLGLNYSEQGDDAKAEALYLRALEIRERRLGPENPTVATDLNNLGLLYSGRSDFTRAVDVYSRALSVYEKSVGPESLEVAQLLMNLGQTYREQGAYSKAESTFVRALEIFETALGQEHMMTALTLSNIAGVRFDEGDLEGAIAFQTRTDDALEGDLQRNLIAGSDESKRLYLRQFQFETDFALSIADARDARDARALRLGCEQILRRKGRALDALVDQLATLTRSGSPEDRGVLLELSAARADYANLALGGRGGDPAERRRALDAARSRVDDLEADASRRSARVRAVLAPVTLDAVARAVPARATLVEYAVYTPYAPRQPVSVHAAPRYVAYTLTSDGTIRRADLGDAKQIDSLVEAFRTSLSKHGGTSLKNVRTEVKPCARALDAKIFAPVRALLGRSTRLLVAPDGQLSLVPFDALVDERGRYATERFEISYLTSGRDLLRLAEHGESRQNDAVFANPDFEAQGLKEGHDRKLELEVPNSPDASTKLVTDLLARANFPPLLGTQAEADTVGRLLLDASVKTGAEANKAALTSLKGPRVLHLATHGFFLADEPQSAEVARGLKLSGTSSESKASEDPLLRSGLAFAGANLHHGSDGILTSLEAAGLDLWGTKLVVLSACETGVGEVHNGEGVYGLRRALVLAGSETQVMSLWSVSDAGTRDLMIEYYRRLAAGEGRSEAMRAVRLATLRRPGRRHPFYWASFIVSGEWANLAGERLTRP